MAFRTLLDHTRAPGSSDHRNVTPIRITSYSAGNNRHQISFRLTSTLRRKLKLKVGDRVDLQTDGDLVRILPANGGPSLKLCKASGVRNTNGCNCYLGMTIRRHHPWKDAKFGVDIDDYLVDENNNAIVFQLPKEILR